MEDVSRLDMQQRLETTTAVDVRFTWSVPVGHEVPVNTFSSVIVGHLNRKTPAFYELLNPMPVLLNEDELRQAIKLHEYPWGPVENIIQAEELPDVAQERVLLHKT
jgi:hypothetical protein